MNMTELQAALRACDVAYADRMGRRAYLPANLMLSQFDGWQAWLRGIGFDDKISGYSDTPEAAIAALRNAINAAPDRQEAEMRALRDRAAALGMTLAPAQEAAE